MNSEKWQQIKAIFNEAIELDSAECEAFLKNQTDAEIVGEVRNLIDAEKENNFAQPIANLSNLWQEDSAEDFIGKEIGGSIWRTAFRRPICLEKWRLIARL